MTPLKHSVAMFEFDCHMVNEALVAEGVDKANVGASRVMATATQRRQATVATDG